MIEPLIKIISKEGFFTIYERLSVELKKLDEKIQTLQVQLLNLSPAKLIITQNGKRYKWYINDGNGLIYLPKSQRRLAEELAKQKYLSLLLKDLIHEKKSIQSYLSHHLKHTQSAQEMLNNQGYQELLSPQFILPSKQLKEWQNALYKRNPTFPEQLIHKSLSGNTLRSKSEALIDMSLFMNKIPFRYECELQLKDSILYPDFTILHPDTMEIFYWEHFGIMDNPDYARNAFSKLQQYNSCDIIPSINLITTYETKNQPLCSSLVEKIVQHYFI